MKESGHQVSVISHKLPATSHIVPSSYEPFDVLVIGGGVTGGGTALDLSLRGLRVALVERRDLTDGTSGRYHGLLHSGGRYAVRDPESARECIAENRILRKIVPHAIEDTGGFFVTTPDDDPAYADTWLAASRACGIDAEETSVAEVLRQEPVLNPRITRAFRVPDASCDGFDVLTALGAAVQSHGGAVLTYHEVIGLILENGKVAGAIIRNVRTGEESRLGAEMVVNAAGAWAGQIAALAGCPVTVRPSKGTMVAMAYRFVNTIINRCHVPGDGDILVPVGTVAVIGTTSVTVADPNDISVQAWEVQRMLDEGENMVPGFSQVRALRRARPRRTRWRTGSGDCSRRQVHHLSPYGRTDRRPRLRALECDKAVLDKRLPASGCSGAAYGLPATLARLPPGARRILQQTRFLAL
jgi:glycerol-3-phosphate dehydrogenase